jgi:hypothetical protein
MKKIYDERLSKKRIKPGLGLKKFHPGGHAKIERLLAKKNFAPAGTRK